VGATLTIAMTDPTNVFAMDDIKFMTGYNIEPVVASESAVQEAIQKYYGLAKSSEPSALDIASKALDDMPGVSSGDVEVLEELDEISVEALARQGEEAPVIRLVNVLLMSAISKGASDIHIEPYEKEYRVRYRIDGVLYNVMNPSLKFRDAIASRLKIMSKLDIAEKRLPQDGRIKIRYNDDGRSKELDFRVSVLPTLFGEKIVLRLLDRDKLMLDMTRLGFESEPLSRFETAIQKPWGMVLVTGPTGSGKTNTLYSSIARLNKADTNIMTAEDPVEIMLPGINQVNINPKVGLTFAGALRAFLRQDPDVIMVGEIRDIETAEIALKAAQTGHLVLSTLHTNDAPKTLTRLVDMGVKPYAIATSVSLIIAQRLARRLCKQCKTKLDIPHEALLKEGFSESEIATGLQIYGPAGCTQCTDGYKGRVGIYEVMPVSEEIGRIIMAGGSVLDIKQQAVREGVWGLRKSALKKVMDGLTSLDEINRVTVD